MDLALKNDRTFQANVDNRNNIQNLLYLTMGHTNASGKQITDVAHRVNCAYGIHTERYKDEKQSSSLRQFNNQTHRVPSYFYSSKVNGAEDAAIHDISEDLTGTFYYKEYKDGDDDVENEVAYIRSGKRFIPVKPPSSEPS
jgi:hypothetical protein